jgi:tetratricopeptide (TPR) repeat protein
LTAASELEPENTEALGLMGDVMVDLNDLAMAERCYRQALEIDDQLVDLRARLANCLSGGGRDDEARVEYERAVEIDGENGALWGAMALLLSRIGDDEAALSAAKKAVDLDAANIDGHNTLATVYGRLGDATNAAAAKAMVGQLTDASRTD